MIDSKVRVDKLVVAIGKVKDAIVNYESGEIYITWKGPSMVIKEAHHIPINRETLTNDNAE